MPVNPSPGKDVKKCCVHLLRNPRFGYQMASSRLGIRECSYSFGAGILMGAMYNVRRTRV